MKRLLFGVALAASMCMLAGCGNSKSAAEATTDMPDEAVTPTVPVELEASEYVKLGKYKGLTIKATPTEVTDKEVDEYLNSLAQEYVEYQEVEDRKTVQDGDFVNIDLEMSMDGKKSEDYSQDDLDIEIGEGNLDFDGTDVTTDDELIGQKVGKTVTIKFKIPDDYDDEEIAGKDCEYKITINSIEKEVVPEITDEFVKDNFEAESVEAYKKQLKDELKAEKEDEAASNNEYNLWEEIVDNAEQIQDFTKDQIEQEKSNIVITYEETAQMYGMELEDFIAEYFQMDMDELAVSNLKSQCVQDLLCKELNINVTDEDVNVAIEKAVKEEGYESREEYLTYNTEVDLRNELEHNQIMEKLLKETTIK